MTRWRGFGWLVWLLWSPCLWAAPDTSMSITPACSSGTTITCSDNTSRMSSITSAYNIHSHTDLTGTTSNSFTVGNGLTGSKSFAIDNNFTTSPSLRYNNAPGDWEFTNDASTFLKLVGYNASALTNGQLLIGNGTIVPTVATLTAGTGITITNGAGTITIAGSASGATDRVVRTSADVTTTNTSLEDFAGATSTVTTTARPVLVGFEGTGYHSGTSNIDLNVNVDGTLEHGTGGYRIDYSATTVNSGFTHQTASLTAGSHTIKLQWKTGSGTATMQCGTVHNCIWWIAEVK